MARGVVVVVVLLLVVLVAVVVAGCLCVHTEVIEIYE